MHIGYVPRERPPFSALNFRSGAYHFHRLPTNPFRRPSFSRSSLPTAGSARTQSAAPRREFAAVPEIRIFTLKTDQARSGDSHFHAQKSSKRLKLVPLNPTFSPSTGSPSRSPCPFFTLPRHIYLPKFGVSTPPPPPPGVSDYFFLSEYRMNRTRFHSLRSEFSLYYTGVRNSHLNKFNFFTLWM